MSELSAPMTTAELADALDEFTASYRCDYAHGPHGIDCCMGTGWLVGSRAEHDLVAAVDLAARALREAGSDTAAATDEEVPF